MEEETALVVQDYNQLKENVVAKVESSIMDDVTKKLTGDAGFLKVIRNYFTEETGLLTKEKIQEKLIEEDAVQIFKDAAEKPELCNLGLFRLQSLTPSDIKKLSKTKEFWSWAVAVTENFSYPLQNENLDAVIIEGLSNGQKFVLDNFSSIIKVVTANASGSALEVFDKLVILLKESDKKHTFESVAAYESRKKDIYSKVDDVFKSIFKILEIHKKNDSFKFYFSMNPIYIKSICSATADVEGENTFRWLEPLLQNLLAYYVHCAKTYHLSMDSSTLWESSKLNEVFEAVFQYSSNPNIRKNILDSYSADNEFLPYLPINLIRGVMDSEEDAQKSMVIAYLKNSYAINRGGIRKDIVELNDSIVLDQKLSLDSRCAAFSWYVEALDSSDKDEKIRWLTDIFNKLVAEDFDEATSRNLPYLTMFRTCFDAIVEVNPDSFDLIPFITNTRNQTFSKECFEKLYAVEKSSAKKILTKLLDENAGEDKENLMMLCMKKLFNESDSSLELAGIQERSLERLLEFYGDGKLDVEERNFFSEVITNTSVPDKMRIKAFDIFFSSCPQDEKRVFFADTLEHIISTDDSGKAMTFSMIERFFDTELSEDVQDKAKHCVDYLWDHKENNEFIKNKEHFLIALSNCSVPGVIEHALRKSW